MYDGEHVHGADELSFGSGREPWLRGWALTHRRLIAISAVMAVVLAGGGAAGWYLYRQSLLPSPPPTDLAFSPSINLTVALCPPQIADCPETARDDAVRAVQAVSEISEFTVVSAEEVKADYQAATILRTGEPGQAAGAIWGTYINATLRSPEAFAAVKRQLEGKPGIARVNQAWPKVWQGRADLGVVLCSLGSVAPCTGAATAAQRDAVVARLREQDGVAEVFLQDQAFGLRLLQRFSPDQYVTLQDVAEEIYVRFDDHAKARQVGQTLLGLPGVMRAYLVL
ncbi:hypothetical protein [Streptosporangium sp. 'caverna']|uniref:hypothetical protein n=1 Tax=Streptosporangium sp. 'caverna' TaxID=2202249 RepID=UPI000D7DC1A6|nr:hypothetical protein [Streptosporangium sp. 'caverna']AWS43040.1 hypothetical protein DKM19_18355 [Streptosporangium sp. 'caverna']